MASCSPYKDLMRLGMLPHLINRGFQQCLQVTRIKMILQKARHARRDLTSPKFFRTRADDDEHIRSVGGKLKSEVNIEIKRWDPSQNRNQTSQLYKPANCVYTGTVFFLLLYFFSCKFTGSNLQASDAHHGISCRKRAMTYCFYFPVDFHFSNLTALWKSYGRR